MNTITTVGIDLAKSTFSLHGVDAHGKTVLRKTLSRNKLLSFMAQRVARVTTREIPVFIFGIMFDCGMLPH